MKDFRNLVVWEKAHVLALKVYAVTKSFPKEEQYGITAQIRRAAVSIPTNIAEGCCRKGSLDFARFLQISVGSASEVEYLLLLAYDLKMLSCTEQKNLIMDVQEIKRMLSAFLKKLNADR